MERRKRMQKNWSVENMAGDEVNCAFLPPCILVVMIRTKIDAHHDSLSIQKIINTRIAYACSFDQWHALPDVAVLRLLSSSHCISSCHQKAQMFLRWCMKKRGCKFQSSCLRERTTFIRTLRLHWIPDHNPLHYYVCAFERRRCFGQRRWWARAARRAQFSLIFN